MSTKTPNDDTFAPIDSEALETVAGGASRSSSNDQVTAMLTQITSSLKDLGGAKNSGSDPMQMMLMMMMMGGFGGGGGGGGFVAGPAAGGGAPVINVDTSVAGGGGGFGGGVCGPVFCPPRRGKKGW